MTTSNHWSAWAQPYLDKALELGLIGDGSDASNKKIATLLDDYDEIINGVPAKMTYDSGSSVEAAHLETDLDDTDNIAPNALITREEAARLVTRALYLTHDNEHLYDDIFSTPFNFINPYTLGYKYAGWTIGESCEIPDTNVKYKPNRMLLGIVCDLDVYTGSTEKDGLWGVSTGYRRDVIVALLNGIIGTDEKYMYNPQQFLTRAEAATIMLRLSDKNERFAQADKKAVWEFNDVTGRPVRYDRDEMWLYIHNIQEATDPQSESLNLFGEAWNNAINKF